MVPLIQMTEINTEQPVWEWPVQLDLMQAENKLDLRAALQMQV